MPRPPTSLLRWNYPFLYLLILETAVLVGMAWCHRVPREHDGFGYFAMQYYFLNNAAVAGELPQWIPYMMQGTSANWWYAVQGGAFVNSVALIAGPLGVLKGLNFLPFFYLGIYFDGLVLLVGTWLLARRLFHSIATVCFVCLIVVGPCIWMNQPWHNFHFYYALPLILALVHRFLDHSSWLSLLLAMTLLALQTVGNLPYYIPVTSMVLVLYFGLYAAFNWQTQVAVVRRLQFGFPAALTVITGLGGVSASFLILSLGSSEIANYSPGRSLDSRVALDTFLTYGGEITLRKWAEPFVGVSPSLDNTLYVGLLSLPLLAVGFILSLKRRYAHVYVLCSFLFLFGIGGIVAIEAYRLWPFMKYFRHIGLTGSLTRLFLCFAAGCGFEAVFQGNESKRRLRVAAALFGVVLCALGVGLFYHATHPAAAQRILNAMHTQTPTSLYAASWPTYTGIFEPRILRNRLVVSGCFAILGGILLGGRAYLSGQRARKILAAAALVLVMLDVYVYKCGEVWLRTTSLPSQDTDLLAFQELPYRSRRSVSFFDSSPRVEALQRDFLFPGIRHWSTNPFAFVDEVGSSFRVDYWLVSLDQILRAWGGQAINDRHAPLAALHPGAGLDFPRRESALKLAGVTADKVQFFRRAYALRDNVDVAKRISDPGYRGDVLFVAPGDHSVPLREDLASLCPLYPTDGYDERRQLDAYDRVELEYGIERFDSNNLVLTIRNTTGSPAWLLFSDVWHPGWSATVNGREVPVYKGVIAYKAVQVPSGPSRVHFRFAIPGVSSLYLLFGFCSVFWLGIVAALVLRTCRNAAGDIDASGDQAPGSCLSCTRESANAGIGPRRFH